jgi:plasmid stabilization system protein ParE
MSKFRLIITDLAADELEAAYWYYELQSEGLGEKYLKELDAIFKVLCEQPKLFPIIQDVFRQVPLKNFPFVVVYDVSSADVRIFAVFHASRNPENKLNR